MNFLSPRELGAFFNPMRFGKWKLLLFLLFFTALYGCKKDKVSSPLSVSPVTTPPNNYVSDQSFKIVAYFPSYRNPDSVDVSKYKMITHLFYAFLAPDVNGNLNLLPESTRFSKLISAARNNSVKVGISVSGLDATFITLASNESTRANLVKNILAFVKLHNLDGVDIDWEYPRTSNGSNITYRALIKTLSDSLHNHNKYLSAAVTAGVYAGAVRDGFSSENFAYLDFVNIMAYDGYGWDKSAPKQHSSYNMAVSSLDTWQTLKGLAKSKTILGIPSYGRTSTLSAGYRSLISAGARSDLDSALYNGAMYYYNGTKTVKDKTALAKQRGNGIMIWEFYFDTNGENSLLKAANDTLGRAYN